MYDIPCNLDRGKRKPNFNENIESMAYFSQILVSRKTSYLSLVFDSF